MVTRDDRPDEHTWLIFSLVAIIVLGSLLLAAKLASGEERTPLPLQTTTEPKSAPRSFANVTPALASSGGNRTAPRETSSPSQASPALAAPVAGLPKPASGAETAPAPAATPPPALAPGVVPPRVSSDAVAIIERACGAFLYGENEHARMPPASLTKIITALVVRQTTDPGRMVDINVSGSAMAKKGSSVMGLEPRMRLSVLDLLYGLFLPSGNDAAIALAEYVGAGNTDGFVAMMNQEARRLGMWDTHFANPHGLDNENLYSSAFDMAIAGAHFLNDSLLAQISTTPTYKPNWNGPPIKNGNRLLTMYPGAFGVKIGYTTNAHQTIVAAAERDGRQLILSVFGSEDRYSDSIALFDWAFANLPSRC